MLLRITYVGMMPSTEASNGIAHKLTEQLVFSIPSDVTAKVEARGGIRTRYEKIIRLIVSVIKQIVLKLVVINRRYIIGIRRVAGKAIRILHFKEPKKLRPFFRNGLTQPKPALGGVYTPHPPLGPP